MKQSILKIVIVVFILSVISVSSYSQSEYRWEYELYQTQKPTNDNEIHKKFNALVDSACAALSRHSYPEALKFIESGLAIYESEFFKEEYYGLKTFIDAQVDSPASLNGIENVEKEKPTNEETITMDNTKTEKENEPPGTEIKNNSLNESNDNKKKTKKERNKKENDAGYKEGAGENVASEPETKTKTENSNENIVEQSPENVQHKALEDEVKEPISAEPPLQDNKIDAQPENQIGVNNESTVKQNPENVQHQTLENEAKEPTATTLPVPKDENITILNSDSDETKMLTEVEMEEFKNKGYEKIKDLERLIKQIAKKETDNATLHSLIESAMQLFDNPDERYVEVSTKNNPVKKRPKVRSYLNNLNMLQYDNVEIEWAELNYASSFILGPDGNYHGTITFSQKFQGYKDNIPIYGDRTTKRIEIILKKYEKNIDGHIDVKWDVFLGDISVEQTE